MYHVLGVSVKRDLFYVVTAKGFPLFRVSSLKPFRSSYSFSTNVYDIPRASYLMSEHKLVKARTRIPKFDLKSRARILKRGLGASANLELTHRYP